MNNIRVKDGSHKSGLSERLLYLEEEWKKK